MDLIQTILDYAEQKLSRALYLLLLRDEPAPHAPKYHQYGVLGHMAAVVIAAERLYEATGEDVRQAALYHDIGKIRKFPDAVALFAQGLDPGLSYRKHESWSARIADGIAVGMHARDLQIIREHGLAYSAKPATIVRRLANDPALIRRWMLLCAADAVGKGWTEVQRQQRPQIAASYSIVAELSGISADDPILKTAVAAILDWELPQVPRFTDCAAACAAT